jgi:hypothetical protein
LPVNVAVNEVVSVDKRTTLQVAPEQWTLPQLEGGVQLLEPQLKPPLKEAVELLLGLAVNVMVAVPVENEWEQDAVQSKAAGLEVTVPPAPEPLSENVMFTFAPAVPPLLVRAEELVLELFFEHPQITRAIRAAPTNAIEIFFIFLFPPHSNVSSARVFREQTTYLIKKKIPSSSIRITRPSPTESAKNWTSLRLWSRRCGFDDLI